MTRVPGHAAFLSLIAMVALLILLWIVSFSLSTPVGGTPLGGEKGSATGAKGKHHDAAVRHDTAVDKTWEKTFNRQFSRNIKTLRAVLRRKRSLEQVLAEEELLEARGSFPSEVLNLRKRRRVLQKKLLSDLEDSFIANQASRMAEVLANLTGPSLVATAQRRMEELQEHSIQAKETRDEALLLDHDEDALRSKGNKSASSLLQQLVDKVDSELGEAIGAVQQEMDAESAWTTARGAKGAAVETVVKVVDRKRSALLMPDDGSTQATEGISNILIDHANNRYVLAKPHDSSIHYEDKSLIGDVMLATCACFVGARVALTLRLPLFFGFIGAGVLLSPTELNALKNLVQVETFSQFGVYFMLFLLGVEFSLEKVKSVLGLAVGGGLLTMSMQIAVSVLLLTTLFHAPVSEGVLIGFCMALSSTAVAFKCLKEGEQGTGYGKVLIGVLVVQDVSLGIMVAVIPILERKGAAGGILGVKLLVALSLLASVVVLFGRFAARGFLRHISKTNDLFILGVVSLCFVTMRFAEELGLSAEVGAFACGMSLSGLPEWGKAIHNAMLPLQDLLAALFFASIGFHIYPSFLMRERLLLLALTFLVVGMKYLIGMLVFHVACRMDLHQASLVSLGLSQMSEFSFVVAAHGKAQGLISKEIYFMLLGTTALTLITTPFLWSMHDHHEEACDSEPSRRPTSPVPYAPLHDTQVISVEVE